MSIDFNISTPLRPLLNTKRYIHPTTGQAINRERFIRIYQESKPLTNVFRDAQGHSIQLWKTVQYGLIGVVFDKNNQLKILPGNKIQNPLNPGQNPNDFIKCLESLPTHDWDIVYDITQLTLTIWPHMQAAGKDDIQPKNHVSFKYRQLETAKQYAEHTVKLPDGRVRYYEPPSKGSVKPGATKDGRRVTEHNPKTGATRSWHECHTHTGRINRVHPKQINGQDVDAIHYPPTGKELQKDPALARLAHKMQLQLQDKIAKNTNKVALPAIKEFQQKLQQTRLTDSYNSTHPKNPVPPKGASGGHIGGVACSTAYIEGLFDNSASLFEQEHTFCLPSLPDGKIPFTDGELKQILRELAIGVYVHSTIPFFSLHFNQNTDMYPVIHPAYENTLVGRVISMLDYMMKGYLNGAIYQEDFTHEWYKDPDWQKKGPSSLEKLITFYEASQSLKGKDREYQSLHESNQMFDTIQQFIFEGIAAAKKESSRELEILKDFTGFSNSFRIIAKQNSFQKDGHLFLLDSDFEVLYTIVPSPEYKIALETYLRKFGTLPQAYLALENQYQLFCKKIHDHMVKIPLCRDYFAMLSVINFFSAYFSTLKKHRKVPVLPAISLAGEKGCPSLFPHLPIVTTFREKISSDLKSTLEEILKKHPDKFKKYFNQIWEKLLNEEEAVKSAEREEMVKFLHENIREPILKSSSRVIRSIVTKKRRDHQTIENAIQEKADEIVTLMDQMAVIGFNSRGPEFVNHIIQMFQTETIKNIIKSFIDEHRADIEEYFLLYRVDIIMETNSFLKPDLLSKLSLKVRNHGNFVSDPTETAEGLLNHIKLNFRRTFNLLDLLPKLFYNYNSLLTKTVELTESRIKPELNVKEIEKGKRVVGGCGMRLEKQTIQTTRGAEEILRTNWLKFKTMEAESWTEVSFGTDKPKGFAFSLLHEDVPAWVSDDYTWMEALLIVPDKVDSELIEKRLEIEELMANGKKDEFKTAVSGSKQLAQMKDRYQQGLLHQAARYEDPFYVQTLIEAGLSVHDQDVFGYLPVHHAAMCDANKNLELMLHHGNWQKMLNARSRDGSTPLTVAIQHDKLSMVRFLLTLGAVSSTHADGYSILHCGLHQGNVLIIDELLSHASLVADCINEMNEVSGTPLMLACELDSLEIVSKLCDLGADPNQVRKDGITAIEIAVTRNCVPVVEYLCKETAPTPQAFELAGRLGSLEMIQCLAKSPSFYQYRSFYKDTILHSAIRFGNIPGALFIVRNCNDLSFLREINGGKENAFSLAVDLPSWDLIEELFDKDATFIQPENMISLLKLEYNPTLKKIFDKCNFTPDQMQNFALIAAQLNNYQALSFIFVPNQVNLELIKGPNDWGISHYLAKSDGMMLFRGLMAKKKNILQPLPEDGSRTLPYIAATYKSYRVLRFLLEQMKKENFSLEKHYKDKHLFCAAIESADLKTIEIFFEIFEEKKKEFLLKALDDKGQTALHLSAQIGSLPLLKWFINQGADVKSRDKSGHDILWFSLRLKHGEMISLLLKEYPNEFINAQNLYMAAAMNLKDCFEAMIKRNKLQINLDEALFLAIQAKNTKAFTFLRRKGASFTFVSSTGMTPLISASQTGQSHFLEEILKDKEIQATLHLGNNAMQHAAINGHVHCVSMLLAAGFKNEKNKDGKSLLELSRNNYWLKRLLESKEKYLSELKNFKASLLSAHEENNLEELLSSILKFPINERIAIDVKGDLIWGTPIQLFLRILGKQVTQDCVKMIAEQPSLDLTIRDSNGNTLAHLLVKADQFPLDLKVDWSATNHRGQTPLHVATQHANAATLQAVIDWLTILKRLDLVNAVDNEGRTPIFEAIKKNKEDKIKILISGEANVNLSDHQLNTPLIFALSPPPSFAIVKILLEAGANPNQCATKDHILPILQSMGMKVDEITRCLISHGANKHVKTKEGHSLAHIAAASGDTQLLRLLVGQGLSISARDSTGMAPVHVAAINGKSEILKAILSMNSEAAKEEIEPEKRALEKSDTEWPKGVTPLHLSAYMNQIESTQLLIKHGASLESQKKDEEEILSFAAGTAAKTTFEQFMPYKISSYPKHLLSAAILAIAHDNLDAVIYLYEKGIPINAEFPNGLTGLQQASIYGSLLTTQWLLLHKADPFFPAPSGEDSLQLSASNDSVEQFALLLDFLYPNLNLDEIRNHRETLMHSAARSGQVNNIVYLIKNFAAIDSKDTKGNTPLLTAAENQQSEVVALLLALGANLTAKTSIDKSIHQLLQEKDEKTKKVIQAHEEVIKSRDAEDSQMHLAVRSKNPLAIRIVSHFGDVNGVNGNGKTPLHLSAETGQITACMHLLDAQANLEATDSDSRTPLFFACMNDLATAEFLIHAGANRHAKDKAGQTVIEHVKLSKLPWKDHLVKVLSS